MCGVERKDNGDVDEEEDWECLFLNSLGLERVGLSIVGWSGERRGKGA
jgi:hypothetical protein